MKKKNVNREIEVGDEAKDKVTGISGVVVVRHDYLYGCARIGIQPEGSHAGKPHEVLHIDMPQGSLISKKKVDREGLIPTVRIQLGSEARDKISGFSGVCIGRAEWLYSCTKVALQPQKLNKRTEKPQEASWFDEPQIDLVRKEVIKEDQKKTGGPCPSVSDFKSTSSK